MLLVHFRKLHPEITISLKIDNREKILAMLAHNEVDLVIMGRVPDELDCETIAFATNPLAIVAPPNHALVSQKNINVTALKGFGFVVREIGSGTRATMEKYFAREDVPLNIVMEMPSNETIKQATMAGMGVSFLSLRTVRHELASGHLKLLEIEGLPIIGNWHLTRLRHRKASPAATAFTKFLISKGSELIDAWA
jgi:DNA-binding transcriptional LysR family regulator